MLGNFADLAFETAGLGDNFLHRRGADAMLRFSKDLIMITGRRPRYLSAIKRGRLEGRAPGGRVLPAPLGLVRLWAFST
jgi:hypothetical protein